MSVDQRLRNGLHSAATGIDPDHRTALSRVEARARRATRVSRWALCAAAVALMAGVGAGVPTLTGRLDGPEPPEVTHHGLEGSYLADVPDTPSTRREQLVGRWVISFEGDGVLVLNPPPGYAGTTAGTAYETRGTELRTDALIDHPGCQATGASNVGTYAWRLRDGRLDLTVIRDDCTARTHLLADQSWTVLPS
jgi:hypothetical protein